MGYAALQSSPGWGPSDRAALRTARRQYAHTQGEAAAHISTTSSVPVTQAQISKWESGSTNRPVDDAIKALRKYVETAPHGVGVTAQDGGGSGMAGVDISFRHMMAGASDEPILGPRQADLVAALSARLGAGPPMSKGDVELARALAQALGVALA